jgi:proline racemase
MTNKQVTFQEYVNLAESLDIEPGTIKRDSMLENMVKFSLNQSMHDSIQVLYNDHMDANGLRLIKFKNPEGQVEYHIHNNQVFPGTKSDNTSKLGFLSAAKIIYDDASKELGMGNPIRFQSIDGSHQHEKYSSMINRLASKHGKTVSNLGSIPLTSAPFIRGEAILVS